MLLSTLEVAFPMRDLTDDKVLLLCVAGKLSKLETNLP